MFTLKAGRLFTLDVQPYGTTVRLPWIGEAFIARTRNVVGRRVTFSPWSELKGSANY